jgi:AbrB family looped-hinge helix DNA binding protein
MRYYTTRMGARGRVVIPAEARKAMHLEKGRPLIVVVEGGEIRLRTIQESIRRAQALARKYVKPGRSLSKELIRERRAEARRESSSAPSAARRSSGG